jgi:hypothetical protein
MTLEEEELFLIGTMDTSHYLQRKVEEDVQKFCSLKDKVLHFLQTYRFMSGWVTSARVVVMGLMCACV